MNLPGELQINSFDMAQAGVATPLVKRRLNYNTVGMTSEVLLLVDLVCLMVAAHLSGVLYATWAQTNDGANVGTSYGNAAWLAAVLAPFILYDKRFGFAAGRGQMTTLVRSFALRFTIFSAVVTVLGAISQSLDNFPRGWLVIWFAVSLASTSLARMSMALYVRRLQRSGVLTEVIAVVGAGPIADQLVDALRRARPESIELLGVFDDKVVGATPGAIKSSGNLARLIELGKTRKIDWIVLTLPSTAEHRVLAIVRRLKALSVPIALCPQHLGLSVELPPCRDIEYIGNDVPVNLLADRPMKRWDALVSEAEVFLPRWIITLALLSAAATVALANALVKFVSGTRIFGLPRHAEFSMRKAATPKLRLVPRSDRAPIPVAASSAPLHRARVESGSRAAASL